MKVGSSYIKIDGSTSAVKKRSIVIGGHKTSLSLESEFWEEFGTIAHKRNLTFSQLVSEIDHTRNASYNLSSAVRVYIINDLMHRVRTSAKAAADAQAKLKAIVASYEASSGARDGHAPIAAVIAGGRNV